MSIFIAIILGLVQGLTEFIPVSSSGHLEIVQQLIGGRADNFHLFLELINFGTLLALIIYYRKRIWEILKDIFGKNHNFKLAINVIITCIPAGIAGLLLSKFIEENSFFSSLITISIAMAVVGVLMIIVDKLPKLSSLKDEHINEAKKIAAYEITKLIHGEEEAKKAEEAAAALFGNGGNLDNMPTTKIETVDMSILDAMVLAKLAPSKGQAKTLIAQGGITLNDEKITDQGYRLSEADFKEGYAILKKGKKVFHKLEK